MSVSLICPSCGTPATLHRAPVAVCPNCQTAWPEPLRLSAEAALAREKVSRPLLLTIAMYVAPTFGGLFLLLLVLAPFDAAHYTIDGEPVTGPEFLRRAGVLFAVSGGSALAAAYAIWRERSWSRWAILAFWLAQVAGAIGFGWAASGLGGAAGAIASLLLVLVLVGWYLFGKVGSTPGYVWSVNSSSEAVSPAWHWIDSARRAAQTNRSLLPERPP